MDLRILRRLGPLLLWKLICSSCDGAAGPDEGAVSFRSNQGIVTSAMTLPANLGDPGGLRWKTEVDPGHSTPIVAQGKIFLTAFNPDSKELETLALDELTGKLLWRRAVVPERVEQTHPIGSPATATPACDGNRVYVYFGSYGLIAYSLDGARLWEHRLGPFQDEYGAGSSPILVDDKVVLNQDHDVDSFLAAYDCATGMQVWRTPRPNAVRSYSTPVTWSRQGRRELLVAGALELSAYNPADGQRLWYVHGLARIVIPMPVVSGDVVYMASWAPGGDAGRRIALDGWAQAIAKWDKDRKGKLAKDEISDREVLDRFYRMDLDQNGFLDEGEWQRHAAFFSQAQNAILALRPDGEGELSDGTVLWKYQRGVPYVATPLLDNGIVWMVKDGGIVTKLDATTGRMLQEERIPGIGSYFASPLCGDGKVYFSSEPGVVSVVANKAEWELLSSHDFHERIYASPVADHALLLIRTERALYGFEQAQRPR